MSERARELLQDAMELPLPERAELAADLLASLDGEVEAAWATEIERRAWAAIADPNGDVSWRRSAPSFTRNEQLCKNGRRLSDGDATQDP